MPDQLSLYNIITAFQGPIRLNDHTFKKKPCPHVKGCDVKRKIDHIERIVITELKAVTIASITGEPR